MKTYFDKTAKAPKATKKFNFKTDDQVNRAFLSLRSQVIDSYGFGPDEEDRFEATIMDEADKLFMKQYGWTYTAALDDVEIKMAAGDQ